MSTDRTERLRRVIQEANALNTQLRQTISQSNAKLNKLRASRPRPTSEEKQAAGEPRRSDEGCQIAPEVLNPEILKGMPAAIQSGLSLEEFLAQHGLDEQGRPLPSERQNEWWDGGSQRHWGRRDERDEDE